MKRKVLFLGCNTSQIPFLKECKKKGLHVVATDVNNKAPGKELASVFYNVSYEDYKSLIEIGKEEKFTRNDYVFTASDQFAYLGSSRFAEYFKIDHVSPKAALVACNKVDLYRVAKLLNVPFPESKARNLERTGKYLDSKNNNKTFYIKSDFGKNKIYIFKTGESGNKLPAKEDRYFRGKFIIQEEVKGNHFRVNYFNGSYFYFFKITDSYSTPIYPFESFKKLEKDLYRLIRHLSLEKMFVKFDLIVNPDAHYLLDIGLNVPIRYFALCKLLKYNFVSMYIDHLIFNKFEYPANEKLIIPAIVKDYKANAL